MECLYRSDSDHLVGNEEMQQMFPKKASFSKAQNACYSSPITGAAGDRTYRKVMGLGIVIAPSSLVFSQCPVCTLNGIGAIIDERPSTGMKVE